MVSNNLRCQLNLELKYGVIIMKIIYRFVLFMVMY